MGLHRSWYLLLFIILLSGCNDSGEEIKQPQLHFVLSGDSKNWEIEGYELQYNGERYESGSGKLTMKNPDAQYSDYFSVGIQVVIDGVDERIQSHSVSGSDMDIINHQIGTIEGSRTFSGEAIKKEDINQIYAIVKWRDSQEERDLKENIELYDREADSND